MMALVRAETFIDKAKVIDLKEKLGQLGEDQSGPKPTLKLRLLAAVKKMSASVLEQHFPANILLSREDDEEEESAQGSLMEQLEEGHDRELERGCETDECDELLDAQLEALRTRLRKKREIAELRRQLSALSAEDAESANAYSHIGFRDVEESLNRFSGDDGYSFPKWLQQFEETAEVLGWTSKMRLVYAKRLMAGTAKLFLRTRSFKSWEELKCALYAEFKRQVTNADIHNQLRARQKKKEETFQQYVFTMQEIASLGRIEESDLVDYIIRGIPDNYTNKLILYNANNLSELKAAIWKYEKMKTANPPREYEKMKMTNPIRVNRTHQQREVKCFNCSEKGHLSGNCPKPQRTARGACYRCGMLGHRANECTQNGNQVMTLQDKGFRRNAFTVDEGYENISNNKFEFYARYHLDPAADCTLSLLTLIDSGSPISLISESFVPPYLINKPDLARHYYGINHSRLNIVGSIFCKVILKNIETNQKLYIVSSTTMTSPVILGRDFLNANNLEIDFKKKNFVIDKAFNNHSQVLFDQSGLRKNTQVQINECTNKDMHEIFNINVEDIGTTSSVNLTVNENISYEFRKKVENIVCNPELYRSTDFNDKNLFEMRIQIIKDSPFSCTPRRLSYTQKLELRKILDDLLARKIIRESNSPYASPIVLVEKKNRETRMCVDFRELNKMTLKDNYPLPLIEDLLDRLRDKKYFSIIDLRSGFHHVRVSEDSIKYTSFVTPLGQYEYLRMPFGLKNAPSVFQRYINYIFKQLIDSDKLFCYMDDLLIATSTLGEHLEILEEFMQIAKINSLELRFDKCKFLFEEIIYLGYIVSKSGIRPNPDNLRAISQFPVPKCTRDVKSFLGLCSYFRKFIQGFAMLAEPLQGLLKKDACFKFGIKELNAFELLKSKLIEAPILAIFSPHLETELHCDASSVGFGAILLQCQGDNKLHPVFYFSKRATDIESRYHSYELETLSIIYALRRFRIYLSGIKFKIVTDCQALTLTLKKKMLNPRISRWVLEMQDYDYIVEHRSGERMKHVDALSRCTEILLLEEDSFEVALAVAQRRDSDIRNIAQMLEQREDKIYCLVNGIVYRKLGNEVKFYVPKQMENRVIQTHHEALCHQGPAKCYEYIKGYYWFPNMKEKIKDYIASCLRCIYFSPSTGKVEGTLHNIPKGDKPFDVIHIDHLGPLPITRGRKKFIFIIVDGFTKYVKLYSVSSTQTREVISCLNSYFQNYSRPNKIISDRGTCFTSKEFGDLLTKNSISHIKVATGSPQSNGQVERINRSIVPMISKELGSNSTGNWYETLPKIEFALNNSVCRSTRETPSMLLFGVPQRGENCDRIFEYLRESNVSEQERDLSKVRKRASMSIVKAQEYNKQYYDQRHKKPRVYKEDDLVMIKNISTTPGVNRKFLAKYRGPYKVIKVLGNDRYLITDVDGVQLGRAPYEGVCAVANMRPYIRV